MPAQIALAIVGGAPPAWVDNLPDGLAEVAAVDGSPVEEGLNRVLARTRAPCFLPVQAGDRLEPAGILALLGALRRAPAHAAGATAAADQIRRDGSLRRTPAAAVAGRSELLALKRIPTPVLFRTEALREAGGWRPGEACWRYRAWRHRGLLARLLEWGSLVATDAYLGVVAPAETATGTVRSPAGAPGPGRTARTPASIRDALQRLLYHRVTVTGHGLRETGRVAAVTPDLLTLAAAGERVTLVPVDRIAAVSPVSAGNPPPVPHRPPIPDQAPAEPISLEGTRPDLLVHHGGAVHRAAPGGRQVTKLYVQPQPTWPPRPS